MVTLYQKWVQGELKEEDVREWLASQSEGKDLNDEELSHVSMCLHHLYLWYKGDLSDYHLGNFLKAVLKNDFREICGMADNTNSKVLTVYAKFLYNFAPADYKAKARRLG